MKRATSIEHDTVQPRPEVFAEAIGFPVAAWFDAGDWHQDVHRRIADWMKDQPGLELWKRAEHDPPYRITKFRSYQGIMFPNITPLETFCRHGRGIIKHGSIYALFVMFHGILWKVNCQTFERDFVGTVNEPDASQRLDYDCVPDGESFHLFRKQQWEKLSPLNRLHKTRLYG